MRLNLRLHFRRYRLALYNFLLSLCIAAASLLVLICGLFRSKSRIPSSIVFSLTSEQVFGNKKIEDLLTSLKEKRFQNHFKVGNLLIEVHSIRSLLVRDNFLTIDAPVFLLSKCVKISHYPAFLMEVFRSVFVFRDQGFLNLREMKRLVFDLALYNVLDQRLYPEIDLVTTNSSLNKLPFAFESPLKGRRVMVWYSSNSKPLIYREEQQSLGWDIGAVKKGIDSHLVWTKYDVAFLESLGIFSAHAIGPILFQPEVVAERSAHNYVITYFNVTPFAPSNDWIIGNQENFYSERNALGDLEGIEKLYACLLDTFGSKIRVRIKPKRSYSSKHSEKYIAKLVEHSRGQRIELLSHNANLYEVVSQSDLVVATPWTSPAVLAKEMSLHSVYFAIRGADWDLPSEYEGIRVFKSSDELMEYVVMDIQKKLVE